MRSTATFSQNGAAAARALEPLYIFWCIPGFLRNEWAHADEVQRP